MHGMSPSRPQGCVQAIYQQLNPSLQFTHCIMIRVRQVTHCMNGVKNALAKVLAGFVH
jgi:hypothetical protein